MSRAAYPSNASIFTWLETEVLPDIAVRKGRENVPRMAILNTGGIRFDIFAGPFTRDSTYIVAPFVSKFRFIPDVPYDLARRVIDVLNGAEKIFAAEGLNSRFLTIPEQMFPAPRATSRKDGAHRVRLQQAGDASQRPLGGGDPVDDAPVLTAGYTTSDDISENGDDTVHAAIDFYDVPNCVQAEIAFPKRGQPEKVDLVFLDFVQPWVLVALRFLGGVYGDRDVLPYQDGTFTYHVAEWIKAHWTGDC
jgi:hypothetical protein